MIRVTVIKVLEPSDLLAGQGWYCTGLSTSIKYSYGKYAHAPAGQSFEFGIIRDKNAINELIISEKCGIKSLFSLHDQETNIAQIICTYIEHISCPLHCLELC